MKRVALLCALAVVAGACGDGATGPPTAASGSASPSPSVATASTGTVKPDPTGGGTTPSPSVQSAGATIARYRLDDRYQIFYCDPDEYPVGVDQETRKQRGREWYAANKNTEEARAIREHHEYREPLRDEQIQVVYEDHKRLRAIAMERRPSSWRFNLVDGDESNAEAVGGSIDDAGRIAETSRTRAEPSCPICLEPSALIDTPSGPVAAAAIRAGDVVWSRDASGTRIAVAARRVVRRPVPAPHLMVRVTLLDGRSTAAAAAHPDARGRTLWSLRAGDALDGSLVRSVVLFASTGRATVDLLPAGPTGAYWADGVLLGSTLS